MVFTFNFALNGIISGFIATVVMTILMMIGHRMNMSPLDLPSSLGKMVMKDRIEGDPAVKRTGMIMHLIMGSLWGLLFVIIVSFYQFSLILGGLFFGVAVWLLMQIFALPMMGAGLFGSKIGMKVPIMSLIMHLVYGVVLGFSVGIIPLT